ncbi:MAG TPA: substrate-binding domain-containing protein [Acidimicrobiales bacterium]|nr:substrate-binding domain-containing protein [Acidimicrobiales bacterium]
MKKSRSRRVIGATIALLPLSLMAITLSGPSGAATTNVNVVGYSVVGPAFSALETAFKATSAGQGVTFTNSFGASTTQAEDVVAGQAADVTVFSTVPDLNLLVAAGLVSKSWASYPAAAAEKGFVTDSVVSLIVRPGNPLGITGWNSLTKSGIQIVTPDPISSGSARWNLLAAYESQIQQKKSATSAKNYVNSLVANVVSEPSSGSKALTTFLSGTGNVLLDYEADAKGAAAAGEKLQIVNPAQNTLIQNPAALTTTGLSNPTAVAFFDYMFSKAGQSIWVHEGFRATLSAVRAEKASIFYQPTRLATVAALGGWGKITAKFFSSSGIVTQIENAHGFTS